MFAWENIFILLAIYLHHRVEELTADCLKLKEFNDALQIEQAVHMKQNEDFMKVLFSLCPLCDSIFHFLFPLLVSTKLIQCFLRIQK